MVYSCPPAAWGHPLFLPTMSPAASAQVSVVHTQLKQRQFNRRRFLKWIYSKSISIEYFSRRDLLNIMHAHFESPFDSDDMHDFVPDFGLANEKLACQPKEDPRHAALFINVELCRKQQQNVRRYLRQVLASQ